MRSLKLMMGSLLTAASAAPHAAAQTGEEPQWEFFGNARLRLAYDDRAEGADRHRQRLRLRLGTKVSLDESLSATVRFSTGPDDQPRNPNVDLGDGFSRIEFDIDQLFVEYAPVAWDGVTLHAGKFPGAFLRTPFYGELLWDADLMPEGVQLGIPLDLGGVLDGSTLTIGYSSVLEQSDDSDAYAAMIFWRGEHGDAEHGGHWDFGFNYLHFTDVTPGSSSRFVNGENATTSGGTDLVSQFGVLQIPVIYALGKTRFSAEYLVNLRADDAVGDTGFALGAGLQTEMGEFYGQYQVIEQDAVLAPTAENDLLFSSNYRSTILGWRDRLSDRVSVLISLFASEPDEALGGPDDMVYRLRFDLNFQF